MAETTNCITIMMGTKGVHTAQISSPPYGNFNVYGNTDFQTGPLQSAGNAGFNIFHGTGNYPNAYSTSSVGGNVPVGNEFVIGKEGSQLGWGTIPTQNSSLANRCVQFAAGRDSFSQGPSVYKRAGSATSYGTNMQGAWPEVLASQNYNSQAGAPAGGGTGHFQSTFYRKTAYPNQHFPSKGYELVHNKIHLGATDAGNNQETYFVRNI